MCTVDVVDDLAGQHVLVRGALTVSSLPDLRLALLRLVDHGAGALRLDLTEAEVLDTTGLGLILECHRRARRAGRDLHVVACTDRTRRLLLGLGLHRVLERPATGTAPLARRRRPPRRTVSTLTA